MHWKADQEIAAVVVGLELGRRRTVAFHNFQDFGNASGAAFETLYTEQGKIGRLDLVAKAQQRLLYLVDLFLRHARGRDNRLSGGIAVLPDYNITAAEILEIVGKGTEDAENWVRIPTLLILDSLALNIVSNIIVFLLYISKPSKVKVFIRQPNANFSMLGMKLVMTRCLVFVVKVGLCLEFLRQHFDFHPKELSPLGVITHKGDKL